MNLITWSLGEKGAVFINDTDSHSGNWCAIQVVNDCVFTSLVDPTLVVEGTITGVTFPAGMVTGGGFQTIQLASGAVWAYNAIKP